MQPGDKAMNTAVIKIFKFGLKLRVLNTKYFLSYKLGFIVEKKVIEEKNGSGEINGELF